MSSHPTTALVLSGGGARGAYEAGVVSYLQDELAAELGHDVPMDLFCGTSVGALNCCALTALADEPSARAQRLVDIWRGLEPEHVLSFGVFDALRLVRKSFGRHYDAIKPGDERYGGLVNIESLRALLMKQVPWLRIGRNLRERKVLALTVAATHVSTGHTIVFIQRGEDGLPPWSHDAAFVPVRARISARHALASAAIPLLFPPVRIGSELYVDGGLRMNVPLTPALRLGAERVIIVSMRATSTAREEASGQDVQAFPSAPFLAGKMLNAIFEESVDQDLDRFERINHVLEAGTTAFGPQFESTINAALRTRGYLPMRQVRTMLVRPSRDIGVLAAEFMNDGFKARGGLPNRMLRALYDRESDKSADLVSYLLFDGGFADRLIDLGRRDARAHRDEWLEFFSESAGEESAQAAG